MKHSCQFLFFFMTLTSQMSAKPIKKTSSKTLESLPASTAALIAKYKRGHEEHNLPMFPDSLSELSEQANNASLQRFLKLSNKLRQASARKRSHTI